MLDPKQKDCDDSDIHTQTRSIGFRVTHAHTHTRAHSAMLMQAMRANRDTCGR